MSLKNKDSIINGEKSARTTKSGNGSRKRSASRVPDVRGSSSSKPDTVSGLRLSGVRKNDSRRRASKLGKSSEGLSSGALVDVERQIAKLNAYRSLLKKKIVLKGVPEDVHKEIVSEHTAWIESQVMLMLGQGSDGFTPDEVKVLKQMVARVGSQLTANKLNQHQSVGNLGPPKPTQKQVRPQAPRPPEEEPVLSESARNAEPLVPRMNQVNMGDAGAADQMRYVDAAKRLEQMEREGPDF